MTASQKSKHKCQTFSMSSLAIKTKQKKKPHCYVQGSFERGKSIKTKELLELLAIQDCHENQLAYQRGHTNTSPRASAEVHWPLRRLTLLTCITLASSQYS